MRTLRCVREETPTLRRGRHDKRLGAPRCLGGLWHLSLSMRGDRARSRTLLRADCAVRLVVTVIASVCATGAASNAAEPLPREAAGGRTRLDSIQREIDRLVAANRSRDALPLALERASVADDVEAWEQVLRIADWNSDREAALRALRAIARLAPGNRGRLSELAKRLLWAKKTQEALPHVRALLADPREADPLTLEVATWVLSAEGATVEASAAARRWMRAAPSERRARRVVADLLQNSPTTWREARDLYQSLDASRAASQGAAGSVADALRASKPDAASDGARERLEALRMQHPTEARVEVLRWFDNVGVAYAAVAGAARAELAIPAALQLRAELGRWENEPVASGASPQPRTRLDVLRMLAGLRGEVSDAVQPEVLAGVELDDADNVAPVGEVAANLRLGPLFARAALRADRHRVSLASAEADVRALGPTLRAYVEPLPWAFASGEAALQALSDGNARARGVAAVGVHNRGKVQLEPRVFIQYDGYRDILDNAVPYFTPRRPLAWGGDVTGRFVPAARTRVEAGIGVVEQDSIVALRPSIDVHVALGRHFAVAANGEYVGSTEYRQARFGAQASYLF